MRLDVWLRVATLQLQNNGIGRAILWMIDHVAHLALGAPVRELSEITPNVHVGGQHHAHGLNRLYQRGITAVINLRDEFDDNHAGIAPEAYLYLPTVDDSAPTIDDLRTGVAFIHEQIAEGGVVYVHCAAGIGRSPTMVAAYLVSTGMSPEEAWIRIREGRPFIHPTMSQRKRIRQFAQRQECTIASAGG